MTDLTISNNSEKNTLEEQITSLTNKLIQITEKVELLKIELFTIKQEYDRKIGILYLRLDEINLKILYFKKIEDLLNNDYSFEEAKKLVQEKLKLKEDKIKEEYQKIHNEESEEAQKKVIDLSKEEMQKLKKLWRKLAHKYHPDLATNDDEREKFDLIMKSLNKAYQNKDIHQLNKIEQENITTSQSLSVETLIVNRNNIKASIIRMVKEYAELKKSEWNIWKININQANKQGRDLFFELEQKLYNDILEKENILGDYQKKYESE